MATRKIVNSQGQVTLTVRQNTFTDTTALGGSLAQKPYSPTATVEETDTGVVITIEDVNGRHTATVRNGEKGDRGIQGIPGEAGVSPTVSVSQTENGVELTITDALGQHTATLVNGRDGADGDSPTCSLAEVEGGVELTVVDATGEHAIFIANGHDGAPGERGLPGQKGEKGDPGDDYVLTNEDKAEIAGMVDVPTKVSDLENDAGYLTSHQDISGKADVEDVPTKLSELDNDVGYLTSHQDISGKADVSDIPTKVSQLTNDAGYISGYTETDPTVPAWAKAKTKPTYTAAEVGALPNTTSIPTKVSQLTNDAGYLTVHQDISGKADKSELPKKVSDLTNDAGFITGYAETDPTVPAWAKTATKPSYTAAEVGALPDNTVIPTKVSDLTDDSGHYTKPAGGIPASDLANGVIPDVPVQDVQINGTSIIHDGIADVPDITNKAPIIFNTASGAITSFADGADNLPVKSLTVNIEPVQDLHGYDHPWPAGGGVNKANLSGASAYADGTYGMYVTVDTEKETITLSGTWDANNTGGQWRFMLVPNIQNGLGLAYFEQTSGNHISKLSWDRTTQRLVIMTKGMTKDTAYTITFKMVAYEGSTAPTVWTPYSNICPITGWTGAKVTRTGKNLYSGGDILLGGDNPRTATVYIDTIPAGAYYLSATVGGTSASGYGMQFFNANGVLVGNRAPSGSLTLTGDAVRIYTYMSTADYNNGKTVLFENIQVELGSTATSYEPYQGETYDITFPTEAGTVYGGNLDVTNGVLTVDRAMVDLGTLAWSKVTSTQGVTMMTAYPASITTGVIGAGILACSAYKAILCINAGIATDAMFPNGSVCQSVGGTSIRVRDDNYTDAALFKSAMSGVQLVYELATPITYQLTPQEITTLLGTNNVWSDAGDTEISYCADTKFYIDREIPTKVSDLTDDSGHYTKPSGGIPASDLAESYFKTGDYAISSEVKAGAGVNKVLTPNYQHHSVFFGLAKAAGDTTQAASANAVGTYTDQAKTAIRSMLGAVGDTEYATNSSAGVVKVNQSYGVLIDDGTLKINSVNTSIKTAVNPNIPVVCSNEHMAVFYGLAKAAGDSTQSSSANAVGVYTDEAKDAIKDMLDVGTVTETVAGTAPMITAKANHRYICGEVSSLSFTPCASGICDVRFTSGSSVTVLTVPSNVEWPDWFDPAELAANTVYELNVVDGVYGVVGTWAT